MQTLVLVGACYLDTILTVPKYPNEDEKLRASSLVRRRGGNCPNTLEVLQQLNSPSHTKLFLSSVLPSLSCSGTCEVKASFGPGANFSHCLYRPECTEPASSFIVKSLETGSRTIVNYNELPEMNVKEFIAMAENVGEAGWWHFEGRIPEVTLQCIHHLRTHFPSAKISVEVEKPNRDGLLELAQEADVVFFSKSWAQAAGYKNPQSFLQDKAVVAEKATLLCCTWGNEGATAFAPKAHPWKYEHVAAWTSEEHAVVDTIGAGDTFIAGMLYGFIRHSEDWSVRQKLEFANELAGRKVVQEGFAGLGEAIKERL